MKSIKKVTSADGEIFFIDSEKEVVWAEDDDGDIRKLHPKPEMFFKFRTDLVRMEDLSTSSVEALRIEK